jgi:hypothetical protein
MVPAVRCSGGRNGGASVVVEVVHRKKDSACFIALAVVRHQTR